MAKWDETRLRRLKELLLAGNTLVEVGNYFGVSKQRVNQIIERYELFSKDELYGKRKTVKEKQDKRKEQFFLKNGFYPEESKDKKTDFWKTLKIKFFNKKMNASRKGIPFDLDFVDLEFPEYCPMLGIKLDYISGGSWNDATPSIDRIDPKLGYVKENVQVISFRANRIKNDATVEELEAIVNYMRKGNKCKNQV